MPVAAFRHGDRPAGFERHAAMPADDQFERHDRMRVGEGGVEVAIALGDDCRFGVEAQREYARRRHRVEARRQRLDLRRHEIGDVFCRVGIGGKHHSDRLADIAHLAARQHRLAIGLQPRHRRHAKADRRDIGDIVARSTRRPRRDGRAPRRCGCRSAGHARPASAPPACRARPVRVTSAANRPAPVKSGRSSRRLTDRPIRLICAFRRRRPAPI